MRPKKTYNRVYWLDEDRVSGPLSQAKNVVKYNFDVAIYVTPLVERLFNVRVP